MRNSRDAIHRLVLQHLRENPEEWTDREARGRLYKELADSVEARDAYPDITADSLGRIVGGLMKSHGRQKYGGRDLKLHIDTLVELGWKGIKPEYLARLGLSKVRSKRGQTGTAQSRSSVRPYDSSVDEFANQFGTSDIPPEEQVEAHAHMASMLYFQDCVIPRPDGAPEAVESLRSTLQSGLYPTQTSAAGYMCGARALAGSISAKWPGSFPSDVDDPVPLLMGILFTDYRPLKFRQADTKGTPTPEYAKYISKHYSTSIECPEFEADLLHLHTLHVLQLQAMVEIMTQHSSEKARLGILTTSYLDSKRRPVAPIAQIYGEAHRSRESSVVWILLIMRPEPNISHFEAFTRKGSPERLQQCMQEYLDHLDTLHSSMPFDHVDQGTASVLDVDESLSSPEEGCLQEASDGNEVPSLLEGKNIVCPAATADRVAGVSEIRSSTVEIQLLQAGSLVERIRSEAGGSDLLASSVARVCLQTLQPLVTLPDDLASVEVSVKLHVSRG